MKHSAPQSGKFKKLVRKLRPLIDCKTVSIETIAVGILERLWHATIVNAPSGDIGKVDDETLCELVGWHSEPSILIEALIVTGWLDECENHRLIIHDWSEHAPSFIKGTLSNAKRSFAVQTKPDITQPSLTKHNLTGMVQTKVVPKDAPKTIPKEPDEIANFFAAFWDAYPNARKTGKKAADTAFMKAVKGGALPHEIVRAATEYANSDVGQGKYVKSPAKWLEEGCWDDNREAWRDPKSTRMSAGELTLKEGQL